MTFLELCRKRRAMRKYHPDPIPTETIRRILEAARHAPSAENRQPWRFIVVTEPEIRADLKRCYPRKWFLESDPPVIIVACGVPSESWHKLDEFYGEEYFEDYWKVDVAIACEHVVLAAEAEGLGSCWIGGFNEKRLRDLLQIPDEWRVLAMISIGISNEDPTELRGEKERKKIEEIVFWDRFQKV